MKLLCWEPRVKPLVAGVKHRAIQPPAAEVRAAKLMPMTNGMITILA